MDYKNLEYFSTTKMLIRDKYVDPSTSLSSTLSSGSALVISAPNQILLLDNKIRYLSSILKREILAILSYLIIYPKNRNTSYTIVNLYNFKLIFIQEQLVVSI